MPDSGYPDTFVPEHSPLGLALTPTNPKLSNPSPIRGRCSGEPMCESGCPDTFVPPEHLPLSLALIPNYQLLTLT